MATTEHFYTGNGSTTTFAFTFPYLSNADIEVELDNVLKTENTSGQTNNDYTVSNTNIVFNSAPGSGVAIHIYRTTNVDSAQAQYAAGSSIRAADLNNNQTQLLYSAQEAAGQLIRQSDLKDSIVNSAKIVDGTIVNADVNASAAIAGTKISPDFGSQNVATTGTVDGRDVSVDGTKLDTIETNAKDDQTAAEIRTLVESATDSNVFTDADHTKLNSIETAATADQTNAEIKTAYEANANTNEFSDAEQTKLAGIETAATADQTNAEIRTAVEAATDSNVFTDADHTKLNSISTNADVTSSKNIGDLANVDTAGVADGKILKYSTGSGAFIIADDGGGSGGGGSNDFFISTLSPAFDGSTTAFTVTNAPSTAQQILISIDGVIQKPNSGTGQPSEGFTLSGSTVTFSSAPASGSSYHVVVFGSALNIGVPSNNSVSTAKIADDAVTSAKIVDGSIVNGDISSSAAIAGTKISPDFGSQNIVTTGTVTDDGATHDGDVTFTGAAANVVFDKSDNALEFADNAKAVFGTGSDLTISHDGSNSIINDTGTGELQLQRAGNTILTLDDNGIIITDPNAKGVVAIIGYEASNANLELIADEGDNVGDKWRLQSTATNNKFNLLNNITGTQEIKWGINTDGDVQQTGHLDLVDDKEIRIGDADDFTLRHNSSDNTTKVTMGNSRPVKFQNATTNTNNVIIGSYSAGTDDNRQLLATRFGDVPKFHTDINGNCFHYANVYAGRVRTDANSPVNIYRNAPHTIGASSGRTDDTSNHRAVMKMTACDYTSGKDDSSILYFAESGSDTATTVYEGGNHDGKFSVKQNGMIEGMNSIFAGRVKADSRTAASVNYSNSEVYFQANHSANRYSRLRAKTSDNTEEVLLISTGGGVVIKFESQGNGRFDGGADVGNAADYAEYFEWLDGNTSSADRRGITVVMDGEKIRPATDSDDTSKIIGIVSANPAVVGDSAWSSWQAAHKKDAYGSWVTENKEYLIWNNFDKISTVGDNTEVDNPQPDINDPNVVSDFQILVSDIDTEKAAGRCPQEAIDQNLRITRPSRVYNESYDPTKTYEPRSARKEWDAIGLLGKLVVRRGQPIGANWVLMKSNVGVDPNDNSIVLDKYLVR